MKKTLVVYKSSYCSTKKYAQWISEELQCEMITKEDAENKNLDDYDTIIYGGGLYAGKINGIDFLTSSFEKIKDKNLILFTCVLGDPNESKNHENIMKGVDKVFNSEMKSRIKVFCLGGGIDYSKLSFVHNAMMWMMYRIILKKSRKSQQAADENKYFIDTYGKAVDFTDRASIEPLINYVRGL